MRSTTRTVLIVIVVLIIVLLAGYFAWQERGSNAPSSVSIATTTVASSTSFSTSTTPGYTITQVPLSGSSAPKAPDYKAPLVFSASLNLSAEEQAAFQQQFAQAQSLIAANAKDFNGWVALGTAREEAGDYQGAAADWEYISQLYPTNVVSFANLGDLYANYLHEYTNAAADYQQELKNNPADPQVYLALYQLYTGPYPQSSATIETLLREGIAADPNYTQLQTTLSQYQSTQS